MGLACSICCSFDHQVGDDCLDGQDHRDVVVECVPPISLSPPQYDCPSATLPVDMSDIFLPTPVKPVVVQQPADDESPPHRAKPKSSRNLIDINTASRRKLVRLHGIGPALADRIIANRPYHRKDELVAVRGIGSKKLASFDHQLAPFESDNNSTSSATGNKFCGGSLETTAIEPIRSSCDLLVASWNVRHLSRKKSMDQLQRICQVIQQFHLVALQEVRDHRVLKRMKAILAQDWHFTASTRVGSSSDNNNNGTTHQEIYAYFYRNAVIRLRGNPSLVIDPHDRFVREPFLAHFELRDLAYDLVVVNIHVVFGKRVDRVDELQQLDHLVDTIDQHVGCLADQVIVLGDFNMPPIDYSLPDRVALIRAPLMTTIFNSLYDNIWLQHHALNTVMQSGVYRIDHKFFPQTKSIEYTNDGAKQARQRCNQLLSDHLPVFVALEIRKSQRQHILSRTEAIRLSHIEHSRTTTITTTTLPVS